jgi:hypothetical protein
MYQRNRQLIIKTDLQETGEEIMELILAIVSGGKLV